MLVPFVGEDYLVVPLPEDEGNLLDRLTPAERATAVKAAHGLSNARIAEEQEVSPNTVAIQLAAAYRKLGVAGRSELATKLALLATLDWKPKRRRGSRDR